MDTNRISVDLDSHDHKLLKTYCASIGVTIKAFVLDCVLQTLEDKEKQKRFQDGLNNRSNSSRNRDRNNRG